LPKIGRFETGSENISYITIVEGLGAALDMRQFPNKIKNNWIPRAGKEIMAKMLLVNFI
jgi:hypothetical protein